MDDPTVPSELPRADTLRWQDLDVDPSSDARIDTAMADLGKQRQRTVVALRRPIPLEEATEQQVRDIAVRVFDPARDVDDLLEVNNAAFEWHPDQGGWDRAELARAMSQRWVDTDGILVHEGEDGHLDGFCWTRIHPADDPDVIAAGDPPLGEIWVIAAHPRTHGKGLGPALVAAGLEHLASKGLRMSVLWTEEDNLAARRMYDRMGFVLYQRRGGYA